jgi:uncharacterized RDD family membrane protein YckC
MASGGAAGSPLGWRFGGFWIRFGARFIDGLVFTIPAAVLFAVVFFPNFIRAQGQARGTGPNAAFLGVGFSTFVVVFFLGGACYEILMLKYRSATLGKMACGLKVIRPDGRSLSWGVCIGRFFMWNVVTSGIPYLNSIFLLATAIIVGVDDEKRALHDRVCDTRVIYKQSLA